MENLNQPIPPESIPTSPPTSSNNRKWVTWILPVIVILTIISVATYYIASQTLKPIPSSIPTTTPQPTQTPDETANWKTFTSQKYNFTLKYPHDWTTHVPAPTGDFEKQGVLNFQRGAGGIEISLEVLSKKSTTVELQENSIKNYDWLEKRTEEINIVGAEGIKVTGHDLGKAETAVVFANGDFIYKLQSVLLEDLEIFDQILSTFRFIDQ